MPQLLGHKPLTKGYRDIADDRHRRCRVTPFHAPGAGVPRAQVRGKFTHDLAVLPHGAGSPENVKPHALAEILPGPMSPPPSASAMADCSSIAEAEPATPSARGHVPARDATFAAIGLALLSTVFFAMG